MSGKVERTVAASPASAPWLRRNVAATALVAGTLLSLTAFLIGALPVRRTVDGNRDQCGSSLFPYSASGGSPSCGGSALQPLRTISISLLLLAIVLLVTGVAVLLRGVVVAADRSGPYRRLAGGLGGMSALLAVCGFGIGFDSVIRASGDGVEDCGPALFHGLIEVGADQHLCPERWYGPQDSLALTVLITAGTCAVGAVAALVRSRRNSRTL